MRRLLPVAAIALVVAAPARAGAPPVNARAYVIEDARTGEILASSHAHDRLPIASITKLMTVLRHAQAPQAHRRRHRRSARCRSRRVVDRARPRRSAHRPRPDQGRADPIGERRRRRARALGRAGLPGLREADERAGRGARAERHALRPPRRARRPWRVLERSRRHEARADTHAHSVRPGDRRRRDRHDRRRTDAPHLGRPPVALPADVRRQDGPHERGGWCQVAAARGRGVTVYATLLGSPTRGERNVDLESLLIWGLAQFRVVPAVQTGRIYAEAQVPYGRAPLALVAAKPLLAVARLGRPLTETVTAPPSSRCRSGGHGSRPRRDPGGGAGRRDARPGRFRTINKPGLPGG